ncbi:hypothetical protein HYS28_01210 [Candidatus Uhrbacteria bacterium]|nr:hypothetical protein [Candidatus Uhrbacteria bacterium]
MLLDAITNHFTTTRGALRLTDAVAYRQDAGHALNQLAVIWNHGEDVVPFVTGETYDAAAVQAMLRAADAAFPDIKQRLMATCAVDRVPDCVALLGNGTASGHAVMLDGAGYAWIALEAYTTRKQVEVFMTHELAHAIHYRTSPEWYPSTRDAYFRTGRAVFTEGLASFVTMRALGISEGDALWADYRPAAWVHDWMTSLAASEHEAWQRLRGTWAATADATLLTANDDAPHVHNRAGYFYGMRLAAQLAQQMSIRELLSLHPAEVASFITHE